MDSWEMDRKQTTTHLLQFTFRGVRMKSLKALSIVVAVFNMTFPLNLFAVESGYDVQLMLQSPTVVEAKEQRFATVWYKVRQSLPREQRTFIDTWVLLHPNFMLPVVEAVKVKSGNGDHAIRLMLQVESELVSIELKNENEGFAKLNGVGIAASETRAVNETLLRYSSRSISQSQTTPKASAAVSLTQAPLSLDFASFSKMSSYEKANLLVNRRLLLESAQRVLETKRSTTQKGRKVSLFSLFAFLTTAEAQDSKPTNKNQCASYQVSCDTSLYGVSTSTGETFCGTQNSNSVKGGKTCAMLSPLRKESLSKDGEELIQSLLAARGKSSKDIQAYLGTQQLSAAQFEYLEKTILQDFNRTINEATKLCEQSSAQEPACEELLQRRVNFNSYLVDLKAKYEDSKAVAVAKNEKPNLIDIEPKTETCNWVCRNKSWALPVGIVGATILSIAGICATKKVSFFGLCTKTSTTETASTTLIETTVTATAPVAPTAPDYTGVK
jgi:hypothetical protein